MTINDVSVLIGTVNGTGSQSANQILMRAIFRWGIPVGGKNVFPSNVQGMPTWFWLRANQEGFIGRKPKANILVGFNSQTLAKDIEKLSPQAVVIVPEEANVLSGDYSVVKLPVSSIVDGTGARPKYKKLLANMAYVGALAKGLGLPWEILEESIKSQFSGEALELNLKTARGAFELVAGFEHHQLQKPQKQVSKKLLMDGNTATALGAIAGGCSFIAWYPITPSSSIVENFNKWAPVLRKQTPEGKNTFVVVQGEDELASACMVLGAGWAGARALTATSGPGFSLMQETIGYAYYAEIPGMIINVQRAGPSTGMPTRTQQGDLLSCIYASHGDTLNPVLMPGTVEECYEFAQKGLELAEYLQQFVILLSDLDLGMNVWMSDELPVPQNELKRGKVLSEETLKTLTQYERYGDPDGDGIPYRTLPGNSAPLAPYFTRGSGHNAKALYSELPQEYQYQLERLRKKWATARTLVPECIYQDNGGSELLVVWGSTNTIVPEYLNELKKVGKKLPSVLRLRAFPLTPKALGIMEKYAQITVMEQNRDAQTAQFLTQEFRELGKPEMTLRLQSLLHFNGEPVSAWDWEFKGFEGGIR